MNLSKSLFYLRTSIIPELISGRNINGVAGQQIKEEVRGLLPHKDVAKNKAIVPLETLA